MRKFLIGLFLAIVGFSMVVPSALAIGEKKWFVSVEDEHGYAVTSANVIVYTAGSTTQATIYSDDQGTSKSNDFAVASNGVGEFYIPGSTTSVDVLVYSGSRAVKKSSFERTDHQIVLPIYKIKRQKAVRIPLGSLLADSGATMTPLSATTAPELMDGGNMPVVKWVDNETTPAVAAFRVPLDYSADGAIRIIASSTETGANMAAYDYDTYVTSVSGETALDTSVTNAAAVLLDDCDGGSSPEEDTITPSDWSALAAGDLVSFRLWRDNTTYASATGVFQVYDIEFIYTAKE